MIRKKLFSIIMITMLLMNGLSLGVVRADEGQGNSPPNPPEPGVLEMLQAYIQASFGLATPTVQPGLVSKAASPKAPAAPEAPDVYYEPSLSPYRLAKAQPDECFNGIGNPYTGTPASNCTDSPYYPNSQPKVNQAYVWGLTQHADNLFFGTAPNTHCLVYGGFLGNTSPTETSSYVCEFGSSQYSPPMPDSLGDWRPPQAFVYNTSGAGLAQLTSPAPPTSTVTFSNTLGLRSAGQFEDTIFLAGPAISAMGGINLFAYDALSGDFISSTTLLPYTNIRKWLNVDGVLYTGVAKSPALGGGGAILRYTGDPDIPGQLFQFQEVGLVGSDAAELTYHDGRLYVSTWPSQVNRGGLYMSPEIPVGGLLPPATQWSKVWDTIYYEPDPLTAALTGGGALASFDGWLYWGTMHVPFMSYMAHMNMYPPNPAWDQETQLSYQLASLFGTHRAIAIFRGRNFDTSPEIQLVYGEANLPAFQNGGWLIVPNSMGGASPLYGASGFGNFYNNYTWTMGVYKDELYVGTMDWSYLLQDGLEPLAGMLGLPPGTELPLPGANPGADLWRFRDAYSSAVPIDASGMGNYTSYGIRTMITGDDFYLGMANPMNLMTNLFDGEPEGGWELVQMVSSPELGIQKWASPEIPLTGSQFSYTLRVTNYGFAEAENVTVRDYLPPGVSYVGSDPDVCVLSAPNTVVCNLGDLPGNDGYFPSWTDLEISVDAPTDVGYIFNKAETWCDGYDPYWENNAVHLHTLVDNDVALEISKTPSHEWVGPGQTLQYSIVITNTGPEDYVTQLPLQVDNPNYIGIPSLGTAYTYPSNMLNLSGIEGRIEHVAVSLNGLNHTRTADLDVMLVSPQGVQVMLMSDAGDGLNFNSNMQLTFDDYAFSYLPEDSVITSGTYRPTDYGGAIDIFPPPAPLGPLEDQLYALRGDDPNGTWRLFILDDQLGYSGWISSGWTLHLTLTRPFLEDNLPNFLFSYGSGGDFLCDSSEGPNFMQCLNLDTGVKSPGETLEETFITSVKNPPPESPPLVFTNTVYLYSGGYPDDQYAQATVTLYPSPDLAMEKDAVYGDPSDMPILPGQIFTYTLTAFNYGLGPASALLVEDQLPPETTFVSADPNCSYNLGDHRVTCAFPQLDPQVSQDFVVTATAPTTVTWITNRVEVDSEQDDAYPEDNHEYLWSLVDHPTDLEMVKSSDHDSVMISQTMVYTLTVINHNPGDFASLIPFNLNVPGIIHIPTFGLGNPYPLETPTLWGLQGEIEKVSVALSILYHGRSSDVAVMLVGPNGKKVMLMSDAGLGGANSVELTFDDEAVDYLPADAPLTSGVFRPTNIVGLFPDLFPFTPPGPVYEDLSVFQGDDPNGAWQLYVVDDLLGQSGLMYGWTLHLTLRRHAAVSDLMPEDMHLDLIETTGWDCGMEQGELTCTHSDPPASSEVLLHVMAGAANEQTISNTAEVISDTYDPNLANNISTRIVNQWKWWLTTILNNFTP